MSLFKTWILLTGGISLALGIIFAVIKLLLWWHHPYIPHAFLIISFLVWCLYGASIIKALDD